MKEGESLVADSGTLYDASIPGGRVGLFAYNQTGVIWSDMRFECKDRYVYMYKSTAFLLSRWVVHEHCSTCKAHG